MNAPLIGCSTTPAQEYDLGLLDLDGVVYVGPHAVPGAAEAIAAAGAAGMRLCYVTNNASRPPSAVADHLCELGIPATAGDVVSSAQAAAALLADRLPAGTAVLVVGGEGLYQALQEVGLRGVASMDGDGSQAPRAVVQGFSPDIGWRLLAEGTRAVRAGLPWMATNTDLTVPTAHGPAPGNGTLVAAVATASGARPEVAGKPEPPLFRQAVRRYGSTRPLVVGDRLDTDIEGAVAAGIPGMLVLSGVCGASDAILAPAHQRPVLLGRDLADLHRGHPRPEPDGSGWRCRDAAVGLDIDLDGTALRVRRAGADPVDLLRAACCAAWSRPAGSEQAGSAGAETPGVPVGVDDVLAALRAFPDADTWSR